MENISSNFNNQPYNDTLLNNVLRPSYMNNCKKKDIHELADQFMNLKEYPENNLSRIALLLDICMESLKEKTSLDFRESLIRSIYSFVACEYKEVLDTLKTNNPNSFVLYQLISDIHAFSSIARKTSEGISLTVGNKGETGSYNTYEEFIFKDSQSLSNTIKIVGMGHNQNLSIDEVYETIKKNSHSHYTLKVKCKDQKINNCAIKNPQALVKYAFATRNFSTFDFINLRLNNAIPFKPKWEPSTNLFHKKLSQRLSIVKPEMKFDLEQKYKKYATLKEKPSTCEQQLDKEF